MKLDIMEMATWMVALHRLEERADARDAKSGQDSGEGAFYATWWMSLWNATKGNAWRLARTTFPDLTS